MNHDPAAHQSARRLKAAKAARALFLALLAWQPTWLALLPPTAGKASWPIALAATLPLLLPLPGVLSLRTRAMVWGGYLALVYFMFGVMEWWSVPGQRLAAGVEVLLSAAFIFTLAIATRKQPRGSKPSRPGR